MTLTRAVARRRTIVQRLGRAQDDRRVQALIAAGGLLLAALARRLAAGDITTAQFIAQATALLQQRAQRAAAVAGAALPDAQAADLIDGSALDGYAADIQSGAASPAQTVARAALWAGLAWGAYQMGRTLAAPPDTQWVWVLDPEADHCDDCRANAAGGPYSRDALPGYPADGSTPCLGHCRCHLEEA